LNFVVLVENWEEFLWWSTESVKLEITRWYG
jgi:hypothetical protein